MHWDSLDTWTVSIAALAAVNCAVLGVFLMLRRLSMMGDAISHSVLPGIAAAFWIGGGAGPMTMFVGAAIVGVLTAVLVQGVHRVGRVEEGASIGVVFTTLFAIGLILIRYVTGDTRVDLDPDCVLFGKLAVAPLFRVEVLGLALPRAFVVLGMMLVVNVAFVGLFFKELRLTAFDPQLADTLGYRSGLMHYLTMTLVAMTSVAAFESVGSILVVALLAAPAATALLITNRLGPVLALAAGVAVASAALGHLLSETVPSAVGWRATNGAGMTAVAAGLLFTSAVLFEPRAGVAVRQWLRWKHAVRTAEEDVLAVLWRQEERPGERVTQPDTTGGLAGLVARRRLVQSGRAVWDGDRLGLTSDGRRTASTLLRSHRLWERYMADRAGVRPDHTHRTAETLEHVTDDALRRKLSGVAGDGTDPHGRPIPDDGP